MAIALTEPAAKEIKRIMAEQKMPETVVLRVGIAGGGCSGFEYKLTFEEYVHDLQDTVHEMHGIRTVVDMNSLPHLDGMEIDFCNGLQNRGFAFNNPNAVRSCGCGSSFSVQ